MRTRNAAQGPKNNRSTKRDLTFRESLCSCIEDANKKSQHIVTSPGHLYSTLMYAVQMKVKDVCF